jgi:hypothetical protein
MSLPQLCFATPRALPKPSTLGMRVVVLDIAFASDAGGQSFTSVTKKFIDALGPRLVRWIDHHDSVHHQDYRDDSRFVLHKKAEHPACPELVTHERVRAAGDIDTVVCHNDFDGLMSAAKWLRAGEECYPGADQDARAVDTRIGEPSACAVRIDRAIRAQGKDHELLRTIVEHLRTGASSDAYWQRIDAAGAALVQLERNAKLLSAYFMPMGGRAVCAELPEDRAEFDKTTLLLLGQRLALIAVVVDRDTVTLAAPFDSGVNFLTALGLSGGMPTVVSLRRERLTEIIDLLQNDRL